MEFNLLFWKQAMSSRIKSQSQITTSQERRILRLMVQIYLVKQFQISSIVKLHVWFMNNLQKLTLFSNRGQSLMPVQNSQINI